MIIQKNFVRRVDDIEETFKLLSFIVNIESHKNTPLIHNDSRSELYVSQEMQCALKAEFLILLYNIVESTICDCLNTLYDSIADENLTYSELTQEMKNMWRVSLKRASNPDHLKTDLELKDTPVVFERLAINISGSLDLRKIIDMFSKHGCIIDESNRGKYADSFLIVKNKRNNLAHGNISFSECGSFYMISDLQKFKNDIIGGLQEIVSQVREYISYHKYKEPLFSSGREMYT